MRTIAFELSMPCRGSWDSKWSGDRREHVLLRRVEDRVAERAVGHHTYCFGDGWVAGVTARPVDSTEAKRLRRVAGQFQGYDWMVTDILEHGRILTLDERRAARAAQGGDEPEVTP